MNTFDDLVLELLSDMGDVIFDRLNEVDQRRLFAAYIIEHPDVLEDVFSRMPKAPIAHYVASLIRRKHTDRVLVIDDLPEFAAAVREAAFPNKRIAALVQGEIDRILVLVRKGRYALGIRQAG